MLRFSKYFKNNKSIKRNYSIYKTNKLKIFDTTLRDGEQSPGATLNINEKLQIAKQLSKLGVDICEAGFPISSPDDFEAVKLIAKEVGNYHRKDQDTMCITGLSRALEKDIDRTYDAVKYAKHHRIHTFIATSNIHLKHKLKITHKECINNAVKAVKHAKSMCEDVQFSAEDAGRSDKQFLLTIINEVINAGATTINIPDTVGYMLPEEYGNLINYLKRNINNPQKINLSTHCHNDLGLATANTLSGIKNGTNQVELTINGIGERAGNTSFEELIMSLKIKNKFFENINNNIDIKYIYETSQMVSKLTGIPIQPNKSIVGENAFLHESGIHQDGVIKNKNTYEIIDPLSIGINKSNLLLGKHSGRNALKEKFKELNLNYNEKNLNLYFDKFKKICDKKKYLNDNEIKNLVMNK